MHSIVITYFSPFENRKKNVSKFVAEYTYKLINNQKRFLNTKIHLVQLPVKSPKRVENKVKWSLLKYKPTLMIMLGETPEKSIVEKLAYARWEDMGKEYYGGRLPTLKSTAQKYWSGVAPFGNTIGNYSCSLALYAALKNSLLKQETVFIHINMHQSKKEMQNMGESIVHAALMKLAQ